MASRFARRSVAAAMIVSAAVMAASAAQGFRVSPRVPSAPKSVPIAVGEGRLGGPWPSSSYRSGYAAEQRSSAGEPRPRPEPPTMGAADVVATRIPYVLDSGSYRLGSKPTPHDATARPDAATAETRAKLETTTQGRSIITAPLKMCPEGQRMYPDRTCGPNFADPENEKK